MFKQFLRTIGTKYDWALVGNQMPVDNNKFIRVSLSEKVWFEEESVFEVWLSLDQVSKILHKHEAKLCFYLCDSCKLFFSPSFAIPVSSKLRSVWNTIRHSGTCDICSSFLAKSWFCDFINSIDKSLFPVVLDRQVTEIAARYAVDVPSLLAGAVTFSSSANGTSFATVPSNRVPSYMKYLNKLTR